MIPYVALCDILGSTQFLVDFHGIQFPADSFLIDSLNNIYTRSMTLVARLDDVSIKPLN
jgi:hypothetical protein